MNDKVIFYAADPSALAQIKSKTYRARIGGKDVEAASGKTFERRSPAHDVVVGVYPECGLVETDNAVAAAKQAFEKGPWPRMSAAEREAVIRKSAQLIRAHAKDWALVESLESGKPYAQALEEMGWAAGIWDYAAGLARHIHGETYNQLGEQTMGLVVREPLGVVALITPWNFPLLIVSQKLPFALAAGCTAVVKPSELTSGTTLLLAKALEEEAGLPAGVVNVLSGFGNPVGARLSEHPDVDMISFTGSTGVGKSVAASAAASNLKKVALELGGKNPQVIFPDADIEAALDAVLFGVYFNMGECCNSGSRILVHETIAEDFVKQLVARAKKIKVGDPLNPDVKLGAIIEPKHKLKILSHIETAQKEGAKLETGGQLMKSPCGCYIEPTIFSGVKPQMTIAREEVFGPVLSVLTFKDADEAARIVNDVAYGLSASVWSKDVDTAFKAARSFRAGTVWINTFMDGANELPFGGYRQSGLGRELGKDAALEYTEAKTIVLHLGGRSPWLN